MTSGSERRSLRCATVTLALVLTAGAAHAEPSAVERETARTLLLSGRAKRSNGDLTAALHDFERAHAIMRVPTTGLDLGKAQLDLGMLVEARATLLEAARHPARADEPTAFKRARLEAKQLADMIAPRLTTLTVAVPNGVALVIDGVELAASSAGAPLKLNPGRHEIVARRGGEEKRATVVLAEGATESLELSFAPLPTPAPAAVTAQRTADPIGASPPSSTTPDAPPESRASPLVWIGLGTALVGSAVGATAGLLAFDAKAEVVPGCDGGVRCPPSTHDDIDRGETFGTVSTAAFVVAGVGLAVMVYGLLTPSRPQGARAHGTSNGLLVSF